MIRLVIYSLWLVLLARACAYILSAYILSLGSGRYFKRAEVPSPSQPTKGSSSRNKTRYAVRTQAEFEAMFNCKAPAGKRYFQHTKLADIIGAYPVAPGLDDQAALEERQQRESFLDFLLGILDLDPTCRSVAAACRPA